MSDTYSRDSFEYLSEDQQDPTLESILAEFKGSAYIAGDKKTSPDLLDERIRRIVKESQDGSIANTELYTVTADDGDFFHDIIVPFGEEEVQKSEPVTLTDDDKKIAARTADIDWEPVKAATSVDEVRREAAAFFAKRDEAVERREEELLREKQEAQNKAEEEARIRAVEQRRLKEEEELRRREEERRKSENTVMDFEALRLENERQEQSKVELFHFSSADIPDDNEPELVQEAMPEPEEDVDRTEILFFDNYRFADSEDSDDVYADDGDYDDYDDEDEEPKQKGIGLFARIFQKRSDVFAYDENEDEAEEQPEEIEPELEPEVYIEEPDFTQEAIRLSKLRNKLMLKSRIALIVAVIMGVFSILFEKGVNILGIGDSVGVFSAVMVVLQLIVMTLSLEVLTRGLTSILKKEIGAETLVLFSNLVTYIACCISIKTGGENMGAPFCAVSAFSAAFSLWGEYRQIAAMSLSLKTAVTSAAPQILSGQYIKDIDRSLIRKYSSATAGFYNNLVDVDIADQTYKFFTPFLLIAAVLLAAVSALGSGGNFIYYLSAIAAAGGSFSAMSAFAVPFSKVAKKLRRSGAAVAGWGGADDIYYADGVRLTDADIFPGGAQVSGPTALENVKPDKILRYSASLMIASNSGLSKGFEDLMNKQGIAMVNVENFECYEGGFAAVIRGERVVCGSAACMALLGIRIPQSVNSKNAIFTAINDTLVGTFNVTYKPSKLVQTSLLSLIRSKVKLFFAVRDFNITPLMVQQKLQIPVDEIEYLPSTDAYRMTADTPDNVPHAAAVIARSTTAVYAETVTSARGLRLMALVNTAVSLITTILGMLVVFLLSWKGEGATISPSNLMWFMLASQAAVILLSNVIGLY